MTMTVLSKNFSIFVSRLYFEMHTERDKLALLSENLFS